MKSKPAKKRLDLLLVERGLADSATKAQAMILAGEVSIDNVRADKAGASIAEDARVAVTSRTQKYASRGGIKLEGALGDFGLNPTGFVCLDVGSSTGGFTDCLLQKGASRVYAVDVNVDQIAKIFPSLSTSSSSMSPLFPQRKCCRPRLQSQSPARTCSSS